jgi:hypothetical protein
MNKNKVPMPILIIGFRRADTLARVLGACLTNSYGQIFVSLDGPRDSNPAEKVLVENTHKVLKIIGESHPNRILIRKLYTNVGSAVHVISSINWFFSQVHEGVILEDDCLPDPSFFLYAEAAMQIISMEDSIWLFSGYRPPLEGLAGVGYGLTHLPLTWGWGTSRVKWGLIEAELLESRIESLFSAFKSGKVSVFWNIGARRIRNGWVDAWDTYLAYIMRANDKRTIFPPLNLISNIGSGYLALNTIKPNKFLNTPTFSWDTGQILIDDASLLKNDECLYTEMNGIGKRHRVLPIVKYSIEVARTRYKTQTPLDSRLKEFNTKNGLFYEI